MTENPDEHEQKPDSYRCNLLIDQLLVCQKQCADQGEEINRLNTILNQLRNEMQEIK